MTPRGGQEQTELPVGIGWISGPGGVDLHPAVTARFGYDGLIRLAEAADALFDDRYGPGVRLWCEANWLRAIWPEVYVPTDSDWSPEWWDQPRAELFNGDVLVLPLHYQLPTLLERTESELVEDLVERSRSAIDDAARRRGWGAVPWDGALQPGGISTRRRPMSDAVKARALERLWDVLDKAGCAPGRPAEDVLTSVAETLHASGRRACNEFLTGLHLALFELDREVLFRQPVRDRGEGDEHPPIPLSEDTFLYARCAVLLSGRAEYDAVLVDPQRFAATWDLDAERLLELPAEVADALGGELQPPPGLPSYETGSNVAYWGVGA